MIFICDNEKCRAVLEKGDLEPKAESNNYCFYCPDCNARNPLRNIGLAGGPLELVQPARQSLPHMVHAVAVRLADGRYEGQVTIKRALGLNGPYAASETFSVGVFLDAVDAVVQAKAQGLAILG